MNDEQLDDLCELFATCLSRAPDFRIEWVDGDGWVGLWTWDGFPNRMQSGPRQPGSAGLSHALSGLLENAARKIRSSGRKRAA